MQIKTLFALGLASLATANTMEKRDAAAINAALKLITPALTNLDKSIAAITAGNAATQLEDVKAKSLAMNDATLAAAKRIKGTPALKGITDAIGLLSSGTAALRAANKTIQDVIAKRQIVLDAKLDGKVKDMLVLNKPGIIAMIDALPGQIPASMTGAGGAGGAGGAAGGAAGALSSLTPQTLGPLIDQGIDYLMGVFRGEKDLPKMPAGGLGGLPTGAPPAAGGSSPAPAAPAPAAPAPAAPAPAAPKASAPKASAPGAGAAPKSSAPKGLPKGKGGKGAKGTFVDVDETFIKRAFVA
jgi:hypothetical protein